MLHFEVVCHRQAWEQVHGLAGHSGRPSACVEVGPEVGPENSGQQLP